MNPLLTPFNYLLQAGLGLFKNNKVATLAVAAALVFFLFNLKQCSSNQIIKKQLAVAEHNTKVLRDSIRVTKDKAGKDETNKLALLTDKVSHLEQLSTDLYSEVKNIKGKVSTVIKSDVKLVHDTVPLIVHSTLIDSIVRADFDYSKDYSLGNSRKLKGYTRYDLRTGQTGGELTQDETTMRFTTGIKNLDKGKPEIFLKSDYPGFVVTALDGAVLDPHLFSKKPKVHLITLGVGVGYNPVSYDFITKKLDFNLHRVGITAGININLIRLLNKK